MQFKVGKKSVFETPHIVNLFRRYVKDWRIIGGLIYVTPKEIPCNYLIFQRRPAGFFDTAWRISVLHDALGGSSMNTALEDLYRKLKGMECLLEWEGLLPRKGVFKINPFLKELRLHIADLQISDELASILNRDEEVMRLVKRVNPDGLTIGLHSIPSEYPSLTESENFLLSLVKEFYRKPTGITWLIALDTQFDRIPGVNRKVEDVVCLFNAILRVLREEVKQLYPDLMTTT
ncbi:MAG: hypothetical protein HA496_02055 [Thaumarchaeota archaeon]|nr:hypothetical protein [Nitrososphaerota archaeon]